MFKLLWVLWVLCLLLNMSFAHAKVIHKERSLYHNILVTDDGDLRCLKFNVKSAHTQQSCFLKSQPNKLVFNYTKLLMSGLLLNPEPKRILIIGLGGGTMSNTLMQLYPQSHIDNVEIDQAVIKVARDYFGFVENNQIKTYQQDGRIFIKRALLKKQSYDWIILDAFNGDYIPEHLMTQEFLQEAKALLSEKGILSSNTFSLSKLYAYESATYKAVFGNFFQVSSIANSNRIIMVSKNGFTHHNFDSINLNALNNKLAPYDVDIKLLHRRMINTKNKQSWSEHTRLLTDQYSPANLLNAN
ncbi:MAG: fused MFS/spermidine synthase [Colwellia sp.]|nr:fused MFS/spermidine synthase [Colwellia sp.]